MICLIKITMQFSLYPFKNESPLTFTVSDKVYQLYARVPDCPSASTVWPAVDKRRHTSIRGTAKTPARSMFTRLKKNKIKFVFPQHLFHLFPHKYLVLVCTFPFLIILPQILTESYRVGKSESKRKAWPLFILLSITIPLRTHLP